MIKIKLIYILKILIIYIYKIHRIIDFMKYMKSTIKQVTSKYKSYSTCTSIVNNTR